MAHNPNIQGGQIMIAITPEDPEWYTPQHILDRVYLVIGCPDIDPCCNRYGPANVIARDYCRLPERDGLTEEWRGVVFLNPPYGREIGQWIDKAVAEYATGHTTALIALMPVKSDTRWWQKIMAKSPCWCAVRGRLNFTNPQVRPDDTQRKRGTFASAIVLCSTDPETIRRFTDAFGDLGQIWYPGGPET